MNKHASKVLECIAKYHGIVRGDNIRYLVDGILYEGPYGHMNVSKVGKASWFTRLIFKWRGKSA